MNTFDDWFNDKQSYSPRSEYFYWEVGFDSLPKNRYNIALDWLKAAYERGYNDAKEEINSD
jgi:hypothetical protein